MSESSSLNALDVPWKKTIIDAIESTEAAFPGGEIFVHLDRKSFKGWQRREIENFLSQNEISIRRGKDIMQE